MRSEKLPSTVRGGVQGQGILCIPTALTDFSWEWILRHSLLYSCVENLQQRKGGLLPAGQNICYRGDCPSLPFPSLPSAPTLINYDKVLKPCYLLPYLLTLLDAKNCSVNLIIYAVTVGYSLRPWDVINIKVYFIIYSIFMTETERRIDYTQCFWALRFSDASMSIFRMISFRPLQYLFFDISSGIHFYITKRVDIHDSLQMQYLSLYSNFKY